MQKGCSLLINLFFETESHVSQVGLELVVNPRITFNFKIVY